MRSFPSPEPEAPDVASPMRLLVWLAGRHRGTVVASVVWGVVCTVAQGLVPAAVGQGIDAGLVARDRGMLWTWAGVVVALGVIQAVTGTLRDRASIVNRLGATYSTMQLVTRQAARLGAGLPRRVSTGHMLAVGSADIAAVGTGLEGLARGSGAIVSIVSIVAVMLATSWQLGVVVMVGVPLSVWGLARIARTMHARQVDQRAQQGELTGIAVDIVGGLRVLRGIGGEQVFGDRYRAESQRVRAAAVTTAGTEATIIGLRTALPGLLIAVIVWSGARLVLGGGLAVGQLIAFYGYAVFLAGQLRRVTDLIDRLTRAQVGAWHIVDVLRQRPEPHGGSRPPTDGTLAEPESGLVVDPGVMTAVLSDDPADAGALADRLGGLVPSSATLGGVSLSDIDRAELRREVVVAVNDDLLFSGSVRECLDPLDRAAGDPGLLDHALAVACATDVVEALPGGLGAEIVGTGRELSGGQQQRMRLARALVADPPTLVLLDGTNAVDVHTEQEIAERLKGARRGRTTVLFTSSPALLAVADEVQLVRDGRVVLRGTHRELIAEDGYASVVRQRAGGA